MKFSKKKLIYISTFILVLCLSGSFYLPNVAATYNVNVNDTWTYDYSGALGDGNLLLNVTSVSQPDGPVLAERYLNSILIDSDYEINNTYILSIDLIPMFITFYGLSVITANYAGMDRDCINLTGILPFVYIVDVETGIILEQDASGIGGDYFRLIDWSISGGGAPAAEWLVEIGDQWTYQITTDGSPTGTMSINVTSVPAYPSPPTGDMYQNGSLYYSGFPLGGDYLEPDIVFDNETIDDLSIGGTYTGDFGGRSCTYVIYDDSNGTEIWIDTATGVALYTSLDFGSNTALLINWSLSGVPSNAEWLLDVGEEWTYQMTQEGTPIETWGFNVTDVPAYPSAPLADQYTNGTLMQSNLPLVGIGINLVFDNETIEELSLSGTYTGDFGGRSCTYVIYDDGVSTITWIDTTTGIALNISQIGGPMEIYLINWTIITPGPVITVLSPINFEIFGDTAPDYDVAIISEDLSDTWYTLNDNDPIYFMGVNGTNTGTINLSEWDDVEDGPVVIKFYANDTVGRVEKTLDQYAANWVAMHTAACEATRIKEIQSEQVMDLRMMCLNRRKRELETLAEVFSRADREVVEKAMRAAKGLSSLAGCEDVEALKMKT